MTSGPVNAEQHLYLVCPTPVRQEGHVNVTQISVTTQTITLLRWEAAVQIGLIVKIMSDLADTCSTCRNDNNCLSYNVYRVYV